MGALPELTAANQATALHLLASGGCNGSDWNEDPQPLPYGYMRRLVHLLASVGADLEAKDRLHQATPLSWAAWFGCFDGVRCMLEVRQTTTHRVRWEDANAGRQ